MSRTRYNYYEFGNKKRKLLTRQIKKEATEKHIHCIKTEDGRCLEEPKNINLEFKKYYQALYKSDHDTENVKIKQFLDKISLPKIDTIGKDLLDAGISEDEVLYSMLLIHYKLIKYLDRMDFQLNISKYLKKINKHPGPSYQYDQGNIRQSSTATFTGGLNNNLSA